MLVVSMIMIWNLIRKRWLHCITCGNKIWLQSVGHWIVQYMTSRRKFPVCHYCRSLTLTTSLIYAYTHVRMCILSVPIIDGFIIHLIDTSFIWVCLTISRSSAFISLRTHAESALSKNRTEFVMSLFFYSGF